MQNPGPLTMQMTPSIKGEEDGSGLPALPSAASLTQRQAVALLEAIPTDTVQGIRDLALMSVFFLTGCRVSAVTAACVGHLETDGVEHYLNVT